MMVLAPALSGGPPPGGRGNLPISARPVHVPSQDGIGLDRQSRPGRSRQPIAESSQHDPIGRCPPDSLDLALENLHLAPKRRHFSLELCLVALARRNRVEEDAHERVEQPGEHGDR